MEHEIASSAFENTATNTGITEIASSVDEIVNCLLTLAGYIGQQVILFIEDLVLKDNNRCSENIVFGSPEQGMSTDHNTRPRVGDRRSEELTVDTRSDILGITDFYSGPLFVFQGFLFPLCGIRLAWKSSVSFCRCYFSYIIRSQAHLCSLVSRVRKTLRGSSDDIGWLQKTPGLPPVKYGTARFMELLEAIRNGEHTLPNSYVYLLIPGLFSNHGPLYFVGTKKFFSKMGLACHIAKIHSEASVEHNAWELKQYIEELYWGAGKPVMLLGHSKGGVDAAAALSLYWSDLRHKVAGLALVQSPYGGTPIASDILREGQIGDKETRRIMELLICKFIKGDIRALEDLTYEKRKEFVMKHKLPERLPIVSFHSEASIGPGVLATMTHIAHAELPWLLPILGGESDICRQVPVVMPVSAAMALCALHLQLRYGENSDGLVTCRDAQVPGSVVVVPHHKLDHTWMVYTSSDKTEACEMCEALLTLLVEIGSLKHHHQQ